MIVKAYPPRMTPEEFERRSDTKGLELVDGVLREKNGGAEVGCTSARIGYHLSAAVLPENLGWVAASEGPYHCRPWRRTVRKPDVSFLLRERLPDGRLPRGICRIRPDLAVEVVAPDDTYEDVEEKLADYFDAGVPLIWVVTPRTRTVLVYRADGTARRLRDTDELTADPIIPGFRAKVADLFPPTAAPTKPKPAGP